MDGGREPRRKGRLDDKRKIQTGQSFLFANRAPDKDSACSGADRGAISLPFSPPLYTTSLSRQLVCAEECGGVGVLKKKKKNRRRTISEQHLGATINQPPRSN